MGSYSILEDCPYDCVNGYIFDVVRKEKVPCPHCADALRQMVSGKRLTSSGKSITDELKIPKSYANKEFNFGDVILDSDNMKVSSVMEMEKFLSGVFSDLLTGVLPDSSYVLNLGSKCDFMLLAFKLLTNAVRGGLRVSPLLCVPYINELQLAETHGSYSEKTSLKEKYGVTYSELRDLDLVVIALDCNTTDIGLTKVKGVMQYRAMVDKPTIVICNSIYNIGVLTIPQESDRNKSYFLGKYISIEYRTDKVAEPINHIRVQDDEPQTEADNSTPTQEYTMQELLGDGTLEDYL